jgi:hypothetical protein
MTKAEFVELLTNRMNGCIVESQFEKLVDDTVARLSREQFQEFLDKAWDKRMIEDKARKADQQRMSNAVRGAGIDREFEHKRAQRARNDAETIRRERKRDEGVQYEGLEGDGLGGLSHLDRYWYRGDDIHHGEEDFGHGGHYYEDYDDDDHPGSNRTVHHSKSDNYGRGIPSNTVYAHQSQKNLVSQVKRMTTDNRRRVEKDEDYNDGYFRHRY